MKGLLSLIDNKIHILETSDDVEYLLQKQGENRYFFHTHNSLPHHLSSIKCNVYLPSMNDVLLTFSKIKTMHFIIMDSGEILSLQQIGKKPTNFDSYISFLYENCQISNIKFFDLHLQLKKINIYSENKWMIEKP